MIALEVFTVDDFAAFNSRGSHAHGGIVAGAAVHHIVGSPKVLVARQRRAGLIFALERAGECEELRPVGRIQFGHVLATRNHPAHRDVGAGNRTSLNAVIHVDSAEHPLLAVEDIAAEDLDLRRREGEASAPQHSGESCAVIREAHSIAAVIELCAVLMEAHIGLDALFRGDADFIGDGLECLRTEFRIADQAGPCSGDLREPDQVLPRAADRRPLEDFQAGFHPLRRKLGLQHEEHLEHLAWNANLVVKPIAAVRILLDPIIERGKNRGLQFCVAMKRAVGAAIGPGHVEQAN